MPFCLPCVRVCVCARVPAPVCAHSCLRVRLRVPPGVRVCARCGFKRVDGQPACEHVPWSKLLARTWSRFSSWLSKFSIKGFMIIPVNLKQTGVKRPRHTWWEYLSLASRQCLGALCRAAQLKILDSCSQDRGSGIQLLSRWKGTANRWPW